MFKLFAKKKTPKTKTKTDEAFDSYMSEALDQMSRAVELINEDCIKCLSNNLDYFKSVRS